MTSEFITLPEGSGGSEMQKLITSFALGNRGKWKNVDDDSATLDIGGGRILCFTTDSFIVTPVFFPGGNIGDLAFAGTVNDLCVMGAKPLGLSLSLVIEEGFPRSDLQKIIETIKTLSQKFQIPIVTGDTKVMEKGKLDGIIINTSGIGIAKKSELLTKKIAPGDKIIISGGLGEHAVALLSKRFTYKTAIVSDSKPLAEELSLVGKYLKQAKDPTRGGIASTLNELAAKNKVGMLLDEAKIPAKPEVRKVVEMLGINLYELACEGRFIAVVASKDAAKAVASLKKFNPDAAIIGEITKENSGKVLIQTYLGKRMLPIPSGRIVPRIC